jgi:hypothetical protein
MSANTETTETTETSCDPCDPIQDAVDEADDSSLFEKIRTGNFTFKKFKEFDFDRFCHTGQVIDEVAVEGRRAIAEGADELPKKGKEFAAEHAHILQSKSEVVQTKVKDGWSSSMATLATLPSKFSEHWNEAAKTYRENKKLEKESETSSALAMR